MINRTCLQFSVPGQEISLQSQLSQGLGGSYKLKGQLMLKPGRTVTYDTVLIYRHDDLVLTYGLSNDITLDTWTSPVR